MGRGRWVHALVAGVMAAAASVGFGAAAIGDLRAATLNSRVPAPAELVRAGVLPPSVASVPDRAAVASLGWALWRSPMDQRLLNRAYVEAARRGDRKAETTDAALLNRLGWRDTATTQNLMLRYALTGEFGALIDRGDSLLRRRQLEDNVFRFFGALETLPPMQGRLVQRLRAGAPWRQGYLGYMVLSQSPPFRAARLRTMYTMLNAGDRVTRAELAPFVSALAENGALEPGWRLWRRAGYLPGGGVGLNDRNFRVAHQLHAEGAKLTPFDWQLGGSGEFAASVPDYRPSGVSLRWNGQGVPVFLSQQLRLPVAERLAVTITSNRPAVVQSLLEPVLTCDGAEIAFTPVAARGRAVSFRAEQRATCAFATLSVRGKVTDDPSPDPIEIDAIDLRAG